MNVHFQINPSSGVPVYRQVMDQVRYYVASGVLGGGAQLPSIRELAGRLAVNPATIVKAYNELAHEGLIELRHGKGVFIVDRPGRLSARQCRQALQRLARQLAVEARQLGADPQSVLDLLAQEMETLSTDEPPSAPAPGPARPDRNPQAPKGGPQP